MPKYASSYLNKLPALAAAASLLGVGLFPSLASAQVLPAGEIQGTIASINSTFNISVDDANGGLDNVELHQGTIINPTGLTLEPGMGVTIVGYADGSQFDANEIDTPYSFNGPAPTPVYYGPGFWYPGFSYGYGPSYSLGFGNGPVLIRRPWVGHWYDSRPIARVAYRPPVFVQPRPEMVRPPAPPQLYRPSGPVAQPRPQFAPQQQRPQAPVDQRPQFAPQQQRPQAPVDQRPQFAPQQQRPQVAPQQPRPQFAPQQPRPQFAPPVRPQAPVAQAPRPQFVPPARPQFNQQPRPQSNAPQARQAAPAAREPMRGDRHG